MGNTVINGCSKVPSVMEVVEQSKFWFKVTEEGLELIVMGLFRAPVKGVCGVVVTDDSIVELTDSVETLHPFPDESIFAIKEDAPKAMCPETSIPPSERMLIELRPAPPTAGGSMLFAKIRLPEAAIFNKTGTSFPEANEV